MDKILIVGGNVVKDAEFRRKMAGRDAAVELQLVLEDLIQSKLEAEMKSCSGGEIELKKEEPAAKVTTADYERGQLKITLKIFLRDFSLENLQEALNTALKFLSTDHVDSLFLAVPTEATPVLGLGSGSGEDEDHTDALNSLIKLWNQVENMIQKEQVLSAGLSDLRPAVFTDLFDKSSHKPEKIQVNLKVCCSVPQELASFAKENNVDVLTHTDPEELLPEETLRNLLYPHLGREAGHFSPHWIVRYLVQVRDRGILAEKRYLAKLAK
eukprot:TRINITY_DN24855_c0_g1_i4.p1 TRINITY_DN24855_c0_g1~~TRINITY_DN24855_c0_g1_i4.p1  ORF type:complete len:281 (+),score=57.73 TRINITY_DN24855_c0_g1_i4:38-844(+)